MNEKEKKIIEQRTIEACRKEYMGVSGKLGTILRHLGEPMYTHNPGAGSGAWDDLGYNSNTLDSYYNIEDDEPKIETMETYDINGDPVQVPMSSEWNQDVVTRKSYQVDRIGWYFQSLTSGINLELQYTDNNKELIVNYKGYNVYKEVGGELHCFVPSEDWEQPVEQFFKRAKKAENKNRIKEKEENIVKSTKNKEKWMEKMAKFWGMDFK